MGAYEVSLMFIPMTSHDSAFELAKTKVTIYMAGTPVRSACLFRLPRFPSVCLCVNSAGQTPRKVRQQYPSEMVDVYCSQCSKKVNLLNDLEARLKHLKANRWNVTLSYL